MIIDAPAKRAINDGSRLFLKRDRFRQGQGEAIPAMIGSIPDTLLSVPLKNSASQPGVEPADHDHRGITASSTR
jgi:hypothetical protein